MLQKLDANRDRIAALSIDQVSARVPPLQVRCSCLQPRVELLSAAALANG